VDPAGEGGLEHGQRVGRGDAAVVDAVRERDEVAREAVAADVRRLPGPLRLDELADGVVERPPAPRAAAVVLAVRADEEERVAGRLARRGEVEVEQVVVPVEPERAQRRLGAGAADERGQPVLPAPLGAPDEEDPRVREPPPLGGEVRLDLRRERRAVDGVVRPEAPVLEQDPGVDPARGRVQRLGVRVGRVRAEGPSRRRGRSPARWPRPRPR
jgi:hypothetical protein